MYNINQLTFNNTDDVRRPGGWEELVEGEAKYQ